MQKGFFEIFSTKIWCALPSFVHGVRQSIEAKQEIDYEELPSGHFLVLGKNMDIKERVYVTNDPEWEIDYRQRIQPDDQFINVIHLEGPITRNGYACSYGSKHHRDQVIFASKQENCIGHIFVMDSPGGSAFSRHDYQVGIDAARAAGQPTIGIVDGMCLSACQAAACMLDKVFYTNASDQFGCIGVMAAFYTLADGTEHKVNGETYHELYDPESFDKNGEYRKLANDNDDSEIIEELAKEGVSFRELVKQRRPNVDDIHLHGKVFTAAETEGILCDGQSSFDECVQMLIDGQAQSNAPSTNNQQEKNQKEMKQYKNINAALKYEEMAVNADGSFYCNEPMAQELDNILGDYITLNESLASHSETIKSLNSKIANLQDELTKAENNSSSATEANEGLEAKISELETEIAKAEETTRSLTNKIADLESQLSAKDALLTEKDKEIEELSQEGTQSPTPSNGQKETVAKSPVNIYTSKMSAKEMREAQQERIKQLSRGI